MKFLCSCGEVIRDQTDYLPYKAYVIGDKNYFDFFDLIDQAIENTELNKETLRMKVSKADPSRLAWECNTCGRLYLDNGKGALVEYLPQNGKANRIFDRRRSKLLG